MENTQEIIEKQSEIVDVDSTPASADENFIDTAKPELSEESTVPVVAESENKQVKKRGRKPKSAVETETGEGETKKPRKPFVYTEKRKEAFERCRVARAEAIKRKHEELAAVKEVKSEVRETLKSIRRLNPDLKDPTVVHALTSLHEHLNMPPRKQAIMMREQQIADAAKKEATSQLIVPQLPAEKIELTQAQAPSLSQRPESILTEPKKRKAVEFAEETTMNDTNENEDEPSQVAEDVKMHDEEKEDSEIDDDTLQQLIELAKQRKRGMSIQRPPPTTYETRRIEVKAPRPNHAEAFLQHTQFHHTNFEASNVVRKGAGTSNFIWM